MKLLEDRILKDGVLSDGGVLKVDCFLNHQIDVSLLNEMGREWKRRFDGCGINKILTIEASGIGIACIAAQHFGCPVVFAKKSASKNIDGEVYSSKIFSFTHDKVYDVIVSKKFLTPSDRVLVIDDFLANGAALRGLYEIISISGATLVGTGIAIEKTFQPGGAQLRAEGYRIESLARIESMENGRITFCKD